LVLIGIGGVLGGIARFELGKIMSQKADSTFPIGTFIINITGAFLLGIVTSMNLGNSFYLFFGEGFLGAYTTFSTFMYEGFNLFQENEKLNAFIYILGSFLLGILGFVIGLKFGTHLHN